MNDSELLELAAKAAGYELQDHTVLGDGLWLYGDGQSKTDDGREIFFWSPLADDGDAFRLAAYLRLEVIPGKHAGDGCSVNSRRHEIPGVTVFRDSKDMAEQMRRAIVMAAAEIGKSMP